eukprot:485500-Prorocentrum_minimum.AAC.1
MAQEAQYGVRVLTPPPTAGAIKAIKVYDGLDQSLAVLVRQRKVRGGTKRGCRGGPNGSEEQSLAVL